MNTKRQAFVIEYLACFNATRAAEKAGYAHPGSQGHRLLKNVEIQQEIKRRLSEKAMSADEVLTRLADMARADISEFVTDGGAIDWQAVQAAGYLVKRISHTKGKNSTIELYDAQRALELLGKRHRLFTETQYNVDLTQLTNEQLERIVAGEDALEVLATSGTRAE